MRVEILTGRIDLRLFHWTDSPSGPSSSSLPAEVDRDWMQPVTDRAGGKSMSSRVRPS
jgi:hypothetical protein